MADSSLLDLATDEKGEIQVGHNGDLLVARDMDVVIQEVLWRLKTVQGDWVLMPDCGANLELLIGEPNTPATAARLEAQIYQALTHDGFLTHELEDLRVVPLNRDQLAAFLTLRYGDDPFTLPIVLDLKEGVL
jgi:hypothetical protein